MATMWKVLTCTNAAFIVFVHVLTNAAFIRFICFDDGENNTFHTVTISVRWQRVPAGTSCIGLLCASSWVATNKMTKLLHCSSYLFHIYHMLILFNERVVKVKTVHMATVSMRWQRVSAVNSSEWLACEKYCIRPPWNSHSCTVKLAYGSYCVNRLAHV